jgi:F-type H+-transporting ATPase subunit delta
VATAAARRYARAVFELAAQQDGDFERWAERLAQVRGIFSDPRVKAVLGNPTISTEQRESLIAARPRILDDEATNLARLLIESGRIEAAADIEDEFQRLWDESAGRVRATVTTAVALKAEDRDRVQKELSRRLEKEVRMTVAVDPRIIGGLKLQYGDRVVDASVASRLQQLRRRLAAP